MAGVISPLELRAAIDKVHRAAGYEIAKSGKSPLGKDVASWIDDIRIELKCHSIQALPQDIQDMLNDAKSKPGKPYGLNIVFQQMQDAAEKALSLSGLRN